MGSAQKPTLQGMSQNERPTARLPIYELARQLEPTILFALAPIIAPLLMKRTKTQLNANSELGDDRDGRVLLGLSAGSGKAPGAPVFPVLSPLLQQVIHDAPCPVLDLGRVLSKVRGLLLTVAASS